MQVNDAYGKLPLLFEVNQGQSDKKVRFLSRGNGYNLSLTATEAVLSLARKSESVSQKKAFASRRNSHAQLATKNSVLRMKLVGANPNPQVNGQEQQDSKVNYFIGNDPRQWHTNIPTYAKVRYQQVYSGIDLIYYGNQRQLEYDFVVAPGADPSRIRLSFSGARKLSLDAHGNLVLDIAGGHVVEQAPIIYQEKDGVRQTVPGSYVLKGNNQVAFSVGEYDPSLPLVIDPILSYSTYLGGTGSDEGNAIAVDAAGNAYVTGTTDFNSAFVAKLSADGSTQVFFNHFGGNGFDYGYGVAVDGSGNIYVAGQTGSTDFPTTSNAFRSTDPSGPNADAYLTKFGPDGSALLYSTYLGGSSGAEARSVAVSGSGFAYLTGSTGSSDFPVTQTTAFQTVYRGPGGFFDADAYITKFDTNASGQASLAYSSFLGGDGGNELGISVAADSAGNAYVTGQTNSTSQFPITGNAYQQTYNGGIEDAFLTRVDTTSSGLSSLVYSTYFGSGGDDFASAVATDGAGNAYVVGATDSEFFPVTAGAFQMSHGADFGSYDAFVSKINTNASGPTPLAYSSFLGGNNRDIGNGIAVDSSGNAYVTGEIGSTGLTPLNAVQSSLQGFASDAFVAKVNANGTQLGLFTYLGGTGGDYGKGIAVDSAGNVYVTGVTYSFDDPTTPENEGFPTANAIQPANASGASDAFVVKLGSPTTNTPMASELTVAAASGIYGGGATLQATLTSAGAPLSGKSVSFTLSGVNVGSATTNDSGVALLSDVSLAGIDAGMYNAAVGATYAGDANYRSSSGSAQLTVARATPLITWSNPAAISYGTPLSAVQLNATASVPGTFSYTPASGTVLNTGSSQALLVSFTPTDTVNYNSASATVYINVTKATPTITWSNPADITYGTALGATQLNASANVPGTYTYTPAAGEVLNAGSAQALTVNFTPGDLTNFNTVSKTVQINVLKATPTVKVTGGTFTYDGQTHPATGSILGVDGENLGTPTFTYNGQSSIPVNSGSYAVVGSYGGSTNYNPASNNSASIVINKATATIGLLYPASTIYDGTPKSVAATTNPPGLGVVSITYNGLATVPVNAGSYAVVASLAHQNYQGSAIGTLVIAPAATETSVSSSTNTLLANQPVTLTATVSAIAPGGGTPGPGTVTFMDGGVSLGSALSNVSGQATLSLPNGLAAGTHSITAVYGGDGGNYMSSQSAKPLLQQVVAPNSPATVQATVGATTITTTFSSGITQSGATTITAIPPDVAPPPTGYVAIPGSQMSYDISTTAAYKGNIDPNNEATWIILKFYVPTINDVAVFNDLRVLHGEGTDPITGKPILVDRTILAGDALNPNLAPNFASRTIYARLPSLSPVTIALVTDKTAPVIENAKVDQPTLWPPNHQMVDVRVTYNVRDNVTPASEITRRLSVKSNEPQNGTGDGDTAPDWEVVGPNLVRLRAERSGKGSGRIYTITITCTDQARNTSSRTVTVTVPHSKK